MTSQETDKMAQDIRALVHYISTLAGEWEIKQIRTHFGNGITLVLRYCKERSGHVKMSIVMTNTKRNKSSVWMCLEGMHAFQDCIFKYSCIGIDLKNVFSSNHAHGVCHSARFVVVPVVSPYHNSIYGRFPEFFRLCINNVNSFIGGIVCKHNLKFRSRIICS